MKIARVRRGNLVADGIVDTGSVQLATRWRTADAHAPFALPASTTTEIQAAAQAIGEAVALDGLTLLPPLAATAKVICLGLNFRAHADEAGDAVAENPALFTKFADTLVGHSETLLRPRASAQFDFEGEIAVVIGRAGRHIAKADAFSHVFGYTIMMDGSLRDYQKHSVSAGKNFYRSGGLGPWIVTADEIPDPCSLSLETRLNGHRVQASSAALMIHDVPTVISYVSRWTPLAPGDVISMGTPSGVGAMRTPPLWMKAGDLIEVQVSGIGTLANPIADEAAQEVC